MAFLIFGGAGYIGSHMTAYLLEKGHEVIVADSLEKGHKQAILKEAKFYHGNILDEIFIEKVFSENKIDAVYHFGNYIEVKESVLNPLSYYENNVVGTIKLLKAMIKHDVKYIIFSSSAAVYGQPENIPIAETDKTKPINPYGETKLAMEKLIHWTSEAHGIKFGALRYFNASGAHPNGHLGEDHRPETHIIPNILLAAMGKKEFYLYGDDYDTFDGTCIRDYIHVMDLAEAHLLVYNHIKEHNVNKIYNIGSGTGYSNKQILETARKVTGIDIKCTIKERRAGDPSKLIASSEKICKELDYKPKYNSLEKIIETAWNFHKNHPDGFLEE